MSFQTALSGLNAANANLNVTGHNVANSSTTGFKKSRAEFADVYAVSFGGVAKTATGNGARLSNVAQQFAQGNTDYTDNNLDLAIQGEGFFTVSDNGSTLYTRAGNFIIDREGYVINSHGHRLQAYQPTTTGFTANAADLHLSMSANPARATDALKLEMNLDAGSDPAVLKKPFDPTNPETFHEARTTTIYDSLGVKHAASIYFRKLDTNYSMGEFTTITGTTAGSANYQLTVEGVDIVNADPQAVGPIDAAYIDAQLADPAISAALATAGVTWTGTAVGGDLTFSKNDLTDADLDIAETLSGDARNGFTTTVAGTSTPNTTKTVTTTLAPPNSWAVTMEATDVSGARVLGDTEVIQFNTDGTLASRGDIDFFDGLADPNSISGTSGTAFFQGGSSFTPSTGAEAMSSMTINFTGSTQFGDATAVNSLVQSGYTTGRLSGLSVDANGIVYAKFTNGQSEALGQVAMARFNNPNGLQQTGDTNWAESSASGEAFYGEAGAGTFGLIQSGALEASNVDISKELVNMIIAQRDFQANAKMISTEDTITQTMINMR